MQAALFFATSAKAGISIEAGIPGYTFRPVSAHWVERTSQPVAVPPASTAGAAAPEASSAYVKAEELPAAQHPGDGKKEIPAPAQKEKAAEGALPAVSPIISGPGTEANVNGAANDGGKAGSETSKNKAAAKIDDRAANHRGDGKA